MSLIFSKNSGVRRIAGQGMNVNLFRAASWCHTEYMVCSSWPFYCSDEAKISKHSFCMIYCSSSDLHSLIFCQYPTVWPQYPTVTQAPTVGSQKFRSLLVGRSGPLNTPLVAACSEGEYVVLHSSCWLDYLSIHPSSSTFHTGELMEYTNPAKKCKERGGVSVVVEPLQK